MDKTRSLAVRHAFAAPGFRLATVATEWPRKHGIYEGSVVKPVGADFVEQKFFRNILVTVGIGRSALCPTWSMV